MARGILYVMTTVVPGLVKIGKTGVGNFESRMYNLEHNGYANVTGLKRCFAIEVDDYDEKEALLDTIFSKSNVAGTELFALDADMVVQLLSSFEGTQIFPENVTKNEVFDTATDIVTAKSCIPDGSYTLMRTVKRWGKQVKAVLVVSGGKMTLQKGAVCCPVIQNPNDTALAGTTVRRASVLIKDNVLQEPMEFSSVSMAAQFVTYSTENGWLVWKNAEGQPVDIYRKKEGDDV